MTSSPRRSPALPLEVLEQIVELHGEVEAEQWIGDFSAQTSHRNHSKTILACHMVSKQFRACALRILCRRTVIDAYDTLERLKRLQDVLFGETHPLSHLGSPARFIQEVAIFLTNEKTSRGSMVHEEIIVPVLKAIADKVPLEKVSIFGNPKPRLKVIWPNCESNFLQAVQAIIQLPSVASLYIRDVTGLSYQPFAMNAHLHTLSILQSDYRQLEVPLLAATSPKLENLFIHHCEKFPDGLQLPALRTVSAHHDRLRESEASWKVIQGSSQTLTSITIHDYQETYVESNQPRFSTQLNVSSFPQLEIFTYSYYCYHDNLFPTLEDVASFFNITCPAPNLRVIEILLFFCGHGAVYDDLVSWVANHDGWGTLDKALASGHFPGITSVHISLAVSFYKGEEELSDGNVYLCDIAEMIYGDITNSFSRSKALSIPIEVEVDVTRDG